MVTTAYKLQPLPSTLAVLCKHCLTVDINTGRNMLYEHKGYIAFLADVLAWIYKSFKITRGVRISTLNVFRWMTVSYHTQHYFLFLWHCGPTRAMATSFLRLLDHTQRRTTVGRTPVDEWLARRRDLYPTTHNTHNRQTSMPRWHSNPRSQQASGRRPTP